jgi:hypothetical protein
MRSGKDWSSGYKLVLRYLAFRDGDFAGLISQAACHKLSTDEASLEPHDAILPFLLRLALRVIHQPDDLLS